jgi:hypothetical protein
VKAPVTKFMLDMSGGNKSLLVNSAVTGSATSLAPVRMAE